MYNKVEFRSEITKRSAIISISVDNTLFIINFTKLEDVQKLMVGAEAALVVTNPLKMLNFCPTYNSTELNRLLE